MMGRAGGPDQLAFTAGAAGRVQELSKDESGRGPDLLV